MAEYQDAKTRLQVGRDIKKFNFKPEALLNIRTVQEIDLYLIP